MFEKILFATTASPACDNAAKVAFDLELKWNAKLYLFHVLGSYPNGGAHPRWKPDTPLLRFSRA